MCGGFNISINLWVEWHCAQFCITLCAYIKLKYSLIQSQMSCSIVFHKKIVSFQPWSRDTFWSVVGPFNTAEPICRPKHLFVVGHAEDWSHSIRISLMHLVHGILSRFVFGHVCLGGDSLNVDYVLRELLNVGVAPYGVHFRCRDWEKRPACGEFWLFAIKMV